MNSLMIGTITNAAKKTIYGIKAVYLQMKNIVGVGGTLSDIDMVAPYGDGCIPPDGVSGVVTPIYGSGKKLYFLGTVNGIPEIPHDPEKGESWKSSLNYVLIQQNDGIRAYRISDEEFNTTLPNGESFVQMMLNRINEMQAEIDYLKTFATAYDGHTHTGVMTGGGITGATSSTVGQPPELTTLAKDKTYLQDGKALIDDLGENYS